MTIVREIFVSKMTLKKISLSLLFLLGGVFVSSSDAQTLTSQSMPLYKEAVPEAILKQYPVLPYNFIDLIKALPQPLPTSLERFKKLFNNPLHTKETHEGYIRYVIGPFRTLDGVIIQKVGISTGIKTQKKVKGFGMYLDPKQCVSTKLLKKEFDFLIPRLLSIHPVPNAPIAYYTTGEHGKFAMGTTMDYSDCATNVGLEAFSDKEAQKEWVKYVRQQAPYLRDKR